MVMIVDLRNTSNLVYFNGTLPVYSSYKLKLVSRYSNKGLLNSDTAFIPLTLDTQETDWFAFGFNDPLTKYQGEMDDYYDCILTGVDALDREFEIQKVLCKVLNNFNTDHPDVNYVSDNEDNEQFIYYNGE
jgi:hypothetical protein